MPDSFRLPLRHIASILGYQDTRSAKRWCKNHSVMVLSDQGTKGSYVIRTEFEAARLLTLVKNLQSRYGSKRWESILRIYTQNDLEKFIAFLSGKKSVKRSEKRKPEECRSYHEQRFLDKLDEFLSEAS